MKKVSAKESNNKALDELGSFLDEVKLTSSISNKYNPLNALQGFCEYKEEVHIPTDKLKCLNQDMYVTSDAIKFDDSTDAIANEYCYIVLDNRQASYILEYIKQHKELKGTPFNKLIDGLAYKDEHGLRVETKKIHDNDYLYKLHKFGGDTEAEEKYNGLEVYVVKDLKVQDRFDMFKEYSGNIVIFEENTIEIGEELLKGNLDFIPPKVIARAYVKCTEYTEDMRFMYSREGVDKINIDFPSLHDKYTIHVTCIHDEAHYSNPLYEVMGGYYE